MTAHAFHRGSETLRTMYPSSCAVPFEYVPYKAIGVVVNERDIDKAVAHLRHSRRIPCRRISFNTVCDLPSAGCNTCAPCNDDVRHVSVVNVNRFAVDERDAEGSVSHSNVCRRMLTEIVCHVSSDGQIILAPCTEAMRRVVAAHINGVIVNEPSIETSLFDSNRCKRISRKNMQVVPSGSHIMYAPCCNSMRRAGTVVTKEFALVT